MPQFITDSLIAGILASFACGLGALPLAIQAFDLRRHTGLAYSAAGGLMFAASVYNLILPGLTLSSTSIQLEQALPVVLGILLGAVFLTQADRYLSTERLQQANWKRFGNKSQLLIFIAMPIHSMPEGVAVGVGYSSETVYSNNLGDYIALAIGIHNIPEGLAVAVPMRAAGASVLLLGGCPHECAAAHRGCPCGVCFVAVPAYHAYPDGVCRRRNDLSCDP